jgi:excisionase family DNA binding protein
MSLDLYSVEQVAQLLGLHVRTVRNYVRAGRLKAFRIGKQYRIPREDLEALTGRPLAAGGARGTVLRRRHVEVSSVVHIEAVSPDEAARFTHVLIAAAKGRPDQSCPLRVETIYDAERARLKAILVGDPRDTSAMLDLLMTVQAGQTQRPDAAPILRGSSEPAK